MAAVSPTELILHCSFISNPVAIPIALNFTFIYVGISSLNIAHFNFLFTGSNEE
jgi:hypothetical protein